MFNQPRRSFLLGGIALGAAGILSQFVSKASAHNNVEAHARLGINLASIYDAGTELPFVDVFKQSRAWVSQKQGAAWGKGEALALDSHGWVTKLAKGQYATRIIASSVGQYPSGQYVVLYEGEGKLAVNRAMGKVVSESAGRIVVEINAAKGLFWLDLLETNPENYVRNIRVMRPQFEATYQSEPWHPDFLKRWAGVACIRTMDWMGANNSAIAHWDDRPKVTDASYSEKGVPVELLVDLANCLEADLWCCMPHLADDHYISAFATAVKSKLKHRVWVEYSNETWNAIFKQSKHVVAQGEKLGFSGNPMEIGAQYTAHRSLEIFKLWQEVYRGESEQIVKVLSGFAHMPVLAEKMLMMKAAANAADVFAIAPYVTLNVPVKAHDGLSDKVVAGWSLDQLFQHVENKALPEANKTIDQHQDIVRNYGLKLVAYESGQHFVGVNGGENNKKLTNLFKQANADARMGDIYAKNLLHWKQAGGDLICSFNSMAPWSKWGSWGLLQNSMEDPKKSAKFSAVVAWAKLQGQNVGQ